MNFEPELLILSTRDSTHPCKPEPNPTQQPEGKKDRTYDKLQAGEIICVLWHPEAGFVSASASSLVGPMSSRQVDDFCKLWATHPPLQLIGSELGLGLLG
jgi:hypothetical protein